MADLTKDPFEEFEFRPINEGLGFHRKNRPQQSTTPTMNSASVSASGMFSPATTVGSTVFAAPLPRSENRNSEIRTEIRSESRFEIGSSSNRSAYSNIPSVEDDSIAKAQTAVNEILKNLNQKRQLDYIYETERTNAELKKSRPILFAAVLDGMLVVAAFLMSMIAMLTITKVDLFMNLSHPETSGMIYLATGLLFVGVVFIYMVVNRAFVGYTPGEWAFDQRLGSEKEIQSMMYIPRIALRSLLNILTGFVLLPFASYLFNKDVAGQITGVNLYRKANAQ
jgi:hypothetical protein